MFVATISDAIIAALNKTLGDHVRQISPLPGNWTVDLLRQAIGQSPSVHVAWLGGTSTGGSGQIKGRWVVYLVAKNASGFTASNRGDTTTIGAYEMTEVAVATLTALNIPDIGSPTLERIENMFSESVADLGGTVFAVTVSLRQPLPETVDPDRLARFMTFHADYNLAPADGTVDATDIVTLP